VSYLFSEDKVDVTGLVLADDGLLVVAGHVVPLYSCNIRKVKSRLSYLFREHFAPFHICSRNEFIGEGDEFHFASVLYMEQLAMKLESVKGRKPLQTERNGLKKKSHFTLENNL
jgi:hypothetical protein